MAASFRHQKWPHPGQWAPKYKSSRNHLGTLVQRLGYKPPPRSDQKTRQVLNRKKLFQKSLILEIV